MRSLRWILLVGGVLLCPVSAWSQDESEAPAIPDFDRLMRRDFVRCADVHFNVYRLAPDYFVRDEPDSLLALLGYWEAKCGTQEVVLRSSILANIWSGSFREDLYDEDILDRLLEWHLIVEHPEWSHGWGWLHTRYTLGAEVEGWDEYNDFTRDLAAQLLPHTEPGSLEHELCRFYAGEVTGFFTRLQASRFDETVARRSYDAEVRRLMSRGEMEFTGGTTLWSPRGGLQRLGPQFGGFLRVGGLGRQWLTHLEIEVRGGRSDEPYTVREDINAPVTTSHFQSAYAGFSVGYSLTRTRHLGLHALMGAGYSGIQYIKGSGDQGDNGGWLDTLNLNGGAELRYYFGDGVGSFVGVQGRYEWTDYDTQGGSDLSGDALVLRLMFGVARSPWRDARLKILEYDRFTER